MSILKAFKRAYRGTFQLLNGKFKNRYKLLSQFDAELKKHANCHNDHYRCIEKTNEESTRYFGSPLRMLARDSGKAFACDMYNILVECSEVKDEDRFTFKNASFPKSCEEYEKALIYWASLDILFPFLLEENERLLELYYKTNSFRMEGPYEFGKEVKLSPGDVVIDCGANMGMFSAIASVKGCFVHAFEPTDYVFEKFLKKTALWNKNITPVRGALWHCRETLEFEIDDGNCAAGHVASLNDKSPQRKKKPVQAFSIDDYVLDNSLDRVDFIKSDIEGAERNMLQGAKRTLEKFAPKLSLCTYHLPDDSKVMREIILDANPKYVIHEQFKKMYAFVP